MSLNADTLLDRIYLKAQARKWRILGIVALGIAAISFLPQAATMTGIGGAIASPDFIARVKMTGIVGDNRKLYEHLDAIRDNDKIKAVIIWLDTPGGSGVGGQELYLRLREISEKKPVVSVMRGIAASAGYMMALGTDHIIAREGTITGSIGVILQSFEVTGLAEKIGVTPITIKSAPLKASPNPLEKLTPESEAVMKLVIDDFYGYFVGLVAERRKMSLETAKGLADGRVFSGKRALDLKLIDQLGGEKEAIKWLQDTKKIDAELKVQDADIKKKPEEYLEDIFGSVAGNFLDQLRVGLDGLVLIWHPNTL